MVARYDVIELKATVTKEGWIRDRPILTRAGVFEYRTPDGKVRREYRPDEEVFSEASLGTLAGIPVTDGHKGLVHAKNVDGIVGAVTSSGIKQDADVLADVIIHNPSRLGKKRELSLGYECDLDETPGQVGNLHYDCVQRNIRYNHAAVVAKGRAGNARLRLDSADAVNGEFELEDEMAETKLVAVRLDGIDYQASPEVLNALTKTQEASVALQKRFDAIEAERDTLKTAAAGHDKALRDARETARDTVRARLDLEGVAESNKVKFDADDTDLAIRVAILGKLRPELRLDGKSEDYVASAFDLTMEGQKDKAKKVTGQLSRFDRAGGDEPAGSKAQEARAAMIARMRGEKPDDKSGKAA
jgi:hypothetical protein